MSHHPERTARNVRPVNQPPSLENGKEKKIPDLAKESSIAVRDQVANGDTDNSKDKEGVKIEPSAKEIIFEEAK